MSLVLITNRYREPIELDHPVRYAKVTPRSVRDVDAIVSLLYDRIDARVFAAAPRLKIVANVAAGYENIDLSTARERGVYVTNVPEVTTEATADLTWALILSVSRRVAEADRWVRGGKFRRWDFHLMLGTDVAGKTLGIIGPGRIGQAVAARAMGFRMRVLFARRSRTDLERVLRESDFVTLHCPLTAQTRHLIGKPELAMMKPTAILVNTARGPIVDEAALVESLRKKRLSGAGLDVYENEPRIHPGLFRLPNVVLLPHIGSATRETRARMLGTALHNVREALAGRVPPNQVGG